MVSSKTLIAICAISALVFTSSAVYVYSQKRPILGHGEGVNCDSPLDIVGGHTRTPSISDYYLPNSKDLQVPVLRFNLSLEKYYLTTNNNLQYVRVDEPLPYPIIKIEISLRQEIKVIGSFSLYLDNDTFRTAQFLENETRQSCRYDKQFNLGTAGYSQKDGILTIELNLFKARYQGDGVPYYLPSNLRFGLTVQAWVDSPLFHTGNPQYDENANLVVGLCQREYTCRVVGDGSR